MCSLCSSTLLMSHPLSARVVVLQAVGTLVFANMNTDLLVGGQSFSQMVLTMWTSVDSLGGVCAWQALVVLLVLVSLAHPWEPWEIVSPHSCTAVYLSFNDWRVRGRR